MASEFDLNVDQLDYLESKFPMYVESVLFLI